MAKKGGKIAAVSVDGWTQMVVYRKDLFQKAGLEPPTSYENITKAVKVSLAEICLDLLLQLKPMKTL